MTITINFCTVLIVLVIWLGLNGALGIFLLFLKEKTEIEIIFDKHSLEILQNIIHKKENSKEKLL